MALPLVCIVLGGNTVQEVLKQAEQATAEGGELIEVRFDKLYVEPVNVTVQNVDGVDETSTEYVAREISAVKVDEAIKQLKKGIDKPVLFTCRSKSEGGQFPDDEEARIGVLEQAIVSGVSWIDIEIGIDPKARASLVAAAKESGATVVASYHDLESTPSPAVTTLVVSHVWMPFRVLADEEVPAPPAWSDNRIDSMSRFSSDDALASW
jgi:3-dehydroquinate dehydratase type I